MTYEELVAKVKDAMKRAKVSRQVGHVAFQFNVEGEAAGIFYLEIADGRINVEPYEYFDRDIVIVTSAEVILQMLEGKIQPRVAYTNGQMQLYGDVRQLEVLPMGSECKCANRAVSE
ncbi:MAG: SCP2 sterol-binding domain-containing protein [Lachnospiraceae bacterium]|nr:SCP2 sterol-binding domain-containing protein [Lachnospiraceae bacterium]